jgi:uncharacterized OB-fold protein
MLDPTLFEPGADVIPDAPLRLRASHCSACGRWEFPARTYCPGCDGEVNDDALSATATVAGVTAVLHAPPGGQIDTPYTVALSTFPEGVSVLGVVLAPFDQVAIGQGIETVGMAVGERVGYGFRPVTR